MLSPSKVIATVALAFTMAGVLLIAEPFNHRSSVVASESEEVAAAFVTGRIGLAPRPCTGPDSEQEGIVRRDRNSVCSPQTWTASDPRLDGMTVASVWNDDVYQVDDGVMTVTVVAAHLRNEDGGWTCSDTGLYEGERESSSSGRKDILTCIGQDEHEGLSAILVVDGPALQFEGLIFSGDFPPVPEPPAAE